jgi:hypothetical protein
MPPRHAYWTILIDGKATAFRASLREELQPTFAQLARKNPDIVLRYYARGKLWDSPEQAQWAARNLRGSKEKRTSEWRPGGLHKDPRARFRPSRKERAVQPRQSNDREQNAHGHGAKVISPRAAWKRRESGGGRPGVRPAWNQHDTRRSNKFTAEARPSKRPEDDSGQRSRESRHDGHDVRGPNASRKPQRFRPRKPR